MSTTPQAPTSSPSTRSHRSRRSHMSRKPKQETIPLLERPLSCRIGVAAERDLVDRAYKSGLLAGQKFIMQELARLLEACLSKHDWVSRGGDIEVCRQKISLVSNPRNPSESQQVCK